MADAIALWAASRAFGAPACDIYNHTPQPRNRDQAVRGSASKRGMSMKAGMKKLSGKMKNKIATMTGAKEREETSALKQQNKALQQQITEQQKKARDYATEKREQAIKLAQLEERMVAAEARNLDLENEHKAIEKEKEGQQITLEAAEREQAVLQMQLQESNTKAAVADQQAKEAQMKAASAEKQAEKTKLAIQTQTGKQVEEAQARVGSLQHSLTGAKSDLKKQEAEIKKLKDQNWVQYQDSNKLKIEPKTTKSQLERAEKDLKQTKQSQTSTTNTEDSPKEALPQKRESENIDMSNELSRLKNRQIQLTAELDQAKNEYGNVKSKFDQTKNILERTEKECAYNEKGRLDNLCVILSMQNDITKMQGKLSEAEQKIDRLRGPLNRMQKLLAGQTYDNMGEESLRKVALRKGMQNSIEYGSVLRKEVDDMDTILK